MGSFFVLAAVDASGIQNYVFVETPYPHLMRLKLLKYQLHKNQELFDKACGYIREYY